MKTIFHNLKLILDDKTKDSQNQILAFGIFGLINYLGFYLVWYYLLRSEGYNSFLLRVIATLLCLLLVLKNYWPSRLKPFLSIYWYLTLIYCLPFFGTFMFLQNAGSSSWETNGMLVIFLLILLVDTASFLVIFTIGWTLGCIAYYMISGIEYIPLSQHGLAFGNYICAILIGIIFAHNRERLQKEKLRAASAVGASIAHELRTPLSAFRSSFKGIKDYFPAFINGYTLAKEAGLSVEHIRRDHYQSLEIALEKTDGEIEYAQTIINTLLMNVKQKNNLSQHPLSVCSMADCIDEALTRYPFKSSKQKKFIHWERGIDFQFKGNKVLMVHVLFNLIKNAIQFVKSAENAGIYISLQTGEQSNRLYFKDMGKGIPAHLLPKIFTRFFTTSVNGTGLGLALCKMVIEGFSGDIKCESKEGHYTQFTLTFPKVVQS